MKIATIVGTRPQYVKLDKDLPNQVIINTGQHYDVLMKDVFMKEFGIKKFDYECGAKDLITMTKKIRTALKKEEPTCVMVYGDCTSTLAGALAAHDLNIPIVHVEGGMRAFRHDMPEERIRITVDHMSHLLLVTDLEAGENLENENIQDGVYIVGNTMFDTFNSVCPIKPSKDHGTYSYLSIHRQENKTSKARLESIFEGIENSEEEFIWPVHPAMKKALKKFKIKVPDNVKMIEPCGYEENMHHIANARKVLTDSGGVQNEAYWLGKHCGLLRRETEWTGHVDDGWTKLLDADTVDIELFMKEEFNHATPRPHMPRFGAKKRIREILNHHYV